MKEPGIEILLIIIYLIFINVLGYIIMGIDKNKAKKHEWRVRERTMFFIAIVGGSLGVWMGMKIFHHKTKHNKFVFGIPSILAIQVILLVLKTF